MRTINVVSLFVVLAITAAVQVHGQSWQIVPGRSAGPITRDTSETELTKIYGKVNVKRMSIDVGEGETQMGTVLFPNDPRRRAYIFWRDPDTRLHPESISIRNKNTLWKTDRGITIGTPLKTIEKLNGGAFILTGFGWDYEGTVLHSNGGQISEFGTGAGEDIAGRTLLLRLAPAQKSRRTPDYKKVLGDGAFPSSDPAMRKLNPVVYQMIVEFPEPAV